MSNFISPAKSYRNPAVIDNYPDMMSQSLLKQSLRDQIKSLSFGQHDESTRIQMLQNSFVQLAEQILGLAKVDFQQRVNSHDRAFELAMNSINCANIAEQQLTRQFVNEHGLVLSPLNCSHTIKDIARLDAYIQSLSHLIDDLLNRQSQVQLLYPACGPFAPLLFPLLAFYKKHNQVSSEQLRVQLVDIQPGAIQSLKQLSYDLDIEDFIEAIHEHDAATFKPAADVDILMLEASQHGFSKEAHFSIAYQLLPYLKRSGVMLPCQIKVHAALVNASREFIEQWQDQRHGLEIQFNTDILAERIELGELAIFDRYSIRNAEPIYLPDGSKVLACNQVKIPNHDSSLEDRILVIYSELIGYNETRLSQYQSGITHPLPDMSVCIDFVPKNRNVDDLILQRGDRVKFFYRLSGLTGFLPIKVESDE